MNGRRRTFHRAVTGALAVCSTTQIPPPQNPVSPPTPTFFEAYWQEKFQGNVLPLRVGIDVATINGVMGVIEILSRRREYTKASPLVIFQFVSTCSIHL